MHDIAQCSIYAHTHAMREGREINGRENEKEKEKGSGEKRERKRERVREREKED
jgi:hypothetical protein